MLCPKVEEPAESDKTSDLRKLQNNKFVVFFFCLFFVLLKFAYWNLFIEICAPLY